MKKSNLYWGIGYLLAGVIFLFLGFQFIDRLSSIFFGLAGAFMGPGIMMIYRYFYWNRPENIERYAMRMEQEQIEIHDELKTKLRDRSGRYAYVLGMCVISISIIVFTFLDALEIVHFGKFITYFLGAYLVFQLIAGWIIYRILLKKYES